MTTLYESVGWVAGTPVNHTRLSQMDAGIRAAQPIGALLWSFSDSEPGYLKLDGSEVSRSTYQDLFDYITARDLIDNGPFGNGDGSTTFDLPDLRDRFMRVTPDGGGVGDIGGAATHVHENPSTVSAGGHSHTNPSTNSTGNHTHSNPDTADTNTNHEHDFATSSVGGHSHSFSDSFTTGGNSTNTFIEDGVSAIAAAQDHSHSGSVSGTTSSSGGHSHSGQTGAATGSHLHRHAQSNTGSSGSHSHSIGITGSVSGHSHAQGDTEATSSLPPYFNINVFVAT